MYGIILGLVILKNMTVIATARAKAVIIKTIQIAKAAHMIRIKAVAKEIMKNIKDKEDMIKKMIMVIMKIKEIIIILITIKMTSK